MAFEGHEDVENIVERRHGERRTRKRPVKAERRRAAAAAKEEIIEVVVGRTGQSERPRGGPAERLADPADLSDFPLGASVIHPIPSKTLGV